MPLPKPDERYTYDDYVTWGDDERWEIIDGYAYNMAPAPKLDHQDVSGNILAFLKQKLKGEKCKVFCAPTDVVFSKHDVVQPDVFVVCDPKKLENRKNVQGAPDLIFEVLSDSTEKKDRKIKKELYAVHGVREYILVNIESSFAERFLLRQNQQYDSGTVFDTDETIELQSLEGVSLPLTEIFATEEEKTTDEAV